MNSTQIVGLVIAISLLAAVLVFLKTRKKPKRVAASNQVADPTLPSVALPQIEIPEATDQRANRLKDRLTKSQSGIGGALKNIFNSSDLSESDWTNLEDELILADVGAKASVEVVEKLRSAVKSAGSAQAANLKNVASQELTKLVDGGFDRSLKVKRKVDAPAVVLTVGVNGTGKTTTTGKLARMLSSQDLDVLLGAADTFRAAAAEQLITWGDRVGVPVVRGAEGGDPAAVAFEAVKTGIENEVDVVLIDTAGRLHTKQGLMDELGKVHRVASKSTSIDEVLLVIDATTGQNGLAQARVFAEVVPVTGVVLTKLDGTAKGGIVIAVQQELGVPVKLVGLGEGPDDLAPFDPKLFVDGLLNVN
ncbi:MAG: signal recognition particle-docking protein FtsY [Actinomycetota bacterium]|jgi:fused signal recognition particle receptor